MKQKQRVSSRALEGLSRIDAQIARAGSHAEIRRLRRWRNRYLDDIERLRREERQRRIEAACRELRQARR